MSFTTTPETKPSVNYVFVDYENVHNVDLSLIGKKTVHLTLLLGARQTKLDAALVEKLMEHASSVQLVRLNSSGKNALDFALAYYVGRAVQADPNAYFHIISKDTGFDPLIEHLMSRQIRARRHADYTTLTFSAIPKPPAAGPDDLVFTVPLASHLAALCKKSTAEVDALIKKLQQAGHLRIGEKEAVTYHLDSN